MQPTLSDYLKSLGNEDDAARAKYEAYLKAKEPLERLQREVRDYLDQQQEKPRAKRPRL
jgi:hypothetical protein